MRKQKADAKSQHSGEGGEIYQQDGKTQPSGKVKGHDLLNDDKGTRGSQIDSPQEAREISEAREEGVGETGRTNNRSVED